jgi:hypothetical protein
MMARSIAFYVIGMTIIANTVLAQGCFSIPSYSSNLPRDNLTEAQNSLCKLGSAGVSCGDAFGDTITCSIKVGSAYAAMEGTPGEAGYQDMYDNCAVSLRL